MTDALSNKVLLQARQQLEAGAYTRSLFGST